jgi:hypothetical protein
MQTMEMAAVPTLEARIALSDKAILDLAEGVGFEPTMGCNPIAIFKPAAIFGGSALRAP